MRRIHYFTLPLLVLIVGSLLFFSRRGATSATRTSDLCPITPQLVQTYCGIAAPLMLDALSCRVQTSGGANIIDYTLTRRKTFNKQTGQEVTLNIETSKQDAVSQMWHAANIWTVYDQKRSAWSPRLVEAPSVGDAAWYIRRPLFTADKQRGLRDPGFVFSVVHQGQVADLNSGGDEVAEVQTIGGSYVPTGAGCALEEVTRFAQEIIVPHLAKAATEETKINAEQHVTFEREKQDYIKRLATALKERREFAKLHCPALEQVASVCTGSKRPNEVQALEFKEKSTNPFITTPTWPMQRIICRYGQSIPEAYESRTINFNDLKGLERSFLEGNSLLEVVVGDAKDSAYADLVYNYTGGGYEKRLRVVGHTPLGRNEIGSRSIRTERALGFQSGLRVVALQELVKNTMCKPEEILKLGALFEKP